MPEIVAFSTQDSRRFGLRVYRARASDLADAEAIISFVRRSDVDLVFARVRVDALDAVQLLESAGFFLTDTLVYYKGSLEAFDAPSAVNVRIQEFAPEHRSQLEAVARSSFAAYRGHYHSDPRLDPIVATEGYVDWCLSTTKDPEGFVLVSLTENQVSGFISVKLLSAETGDILLNAVSPEFRKRGVYTALVQAAGMHLKKNGRREIMASTQLSNLPPQRVWVRYGLEFFEAFYTLHGWSSA